MPRMPVRARAHPDGIQRRLETMLSGSPVSGKVLVQICRAALWTPIIVLIVHSIAGKIFGHEPYVDPIMHFSGGLAIAFFCWRACLIEPEFLGKPSRLGIDLLAYGLTCAAALFWEFGEFIGDQVRGTNVQRGLGNTMRDLFLGTLGGIVFIVGARLVRSSKKSSFQ
jgi:hypothetical protein